VLLNRLADEGSGGRMEREFGERGKESALVGEGARRCMVLELSKLWEDIVVQLR
jgi:hypothetical protein